LTSHTKGRKRLRVFENRVLGRIFGRKNEKVAGGWRTVHNEELRNSYASPNFVRIIILRRIWAGHVARMGEFKSVYTILVGKFEGKRPLGRPRRGCEGNINGC
jgi:hypothetical protein